MVSHYAALNRDYPAHANDDHGAGYQTERLAADAQKVPAPMSEAKTEKEPDFWNSMPGKVIEDLGHVIKWGTVGALFSIAALGVCSFVPGVAPLINTIAGTNIFPAMGMFTPAETARMVLTVGGVYGGMAGVALGTAFKVIEETVGLVRDLVVGEVRSIAGAATGAQTPSEPANEPANEPERPAAMNARRLVHTQPENGGWQGGYALA